MDAKIQAQLREKFDVAVIGKKPTIWCKACSDAIKNRRYSCDKHERKRCRPAPDGCGQNITEAHLHIEFVSHSEVTDRLLAVDPEWSWEPMGFEPNGLPALDSNGGLWIKLTIAGVTRVGYGGSDNKQGDNAVKEAISDAIKTTAMRFGVALDLWRKQEESGKAANDLAARQEHGQPAPAPQQPANGNARQRPAQPPKDASVGPSVADAVAELKAACEANGWNRDIVAVKYAEKAGHGLGDATDPALIESFRKHLFTLPQAELQPAAKEAAA